MKIKTILQKIGKFFLTLLGLLSLNLLISVVAYFFVMLLWAMVGDDNQYKMMNELGYHTAIAMFVLMVVVEIIWYSIKPTWL